MKKGAKLIFSQCDQFLAVLRKVTFKFNVHSKKKVVERT